MFLLKTVVKRMLPYVLQEIASIDLQPSLCSLMA
jgi:hypothetical protein